MQGRDDGREWWRTDLCAIDASGLFFVLFLVHLVKGPRDVLIQRRRRKKEG